MASNPAVESGEEGAGGSSSSDYEEDCYFAFVEKSETPSFDIDDPEWVDDDDGDAFEIVDGDVTCVGDVIDPQLGETCLVEAEFYNQKPGRGKRKPVKGVRVKFQDLSKPYVARVTNQTNYHRFLQLVKGEEPPTDMPNNTEQIPEELKGLNPEEQEKQKEIWAKELATVSVLYYLIPSVVAKLKALGGYGPPPEFEGLSKEEQEALQEEWSKELMTLEEEVQTLQDVWASKTERIRELKAKLGYSVWSDLTSQMNKGISNVKESHVYQKTESVIKSTAEKTTSLLGGFGSGFTSGISSKLGAIKNSESFRSFEEKVGGVYENVKTKVSTSRSSSMQSFDDALREAEAAIKKGGSGATTPIPEERP
ncbi:uncharacterized protein [Bemisia tabaci]|uniref:uncharacterized protein isoform X2 n=1 Tax=Bemisia tabaci TaxID=7038 RepID=UPI0008F9BEDE|nr:PREDICTED: uncharacterized protein LOC109041130 isoform X1 [Bemisia tabaci]